MNDSVAEHVRSSWAKVLEVPDSEIADPSHFFECGGDSLMAVELVVSLQEALGVEVPLDAILLDGTFGELLRVCEELVVAGP